MFFGGDPFEHFSHGGQGSRGGAGGGADVDTSKLYETLGVAKDADEKMIKKAYRKLASKHHPDKGGDADKFKEVSAAYEILSDKESRVKYDKYGLEGVGDDGGGGGRHGSEDLFSMFFGGGGGGGGRGRSAGKRKGPDVSHKLSVSLEDLYNGKTVKMAVKRKVIVGTATTCTRCRGQGAVMEVRQVGPGMISQMQRTCDECSGQGHTAQTKVEKKVLEVHIDKGMRDTEKVVFREMADEHPNMETGNVNFVVQEKEHNLFTRKGADLLMVKELSLNQALCGFKFVITHLDKRKVCIQSKSGEIIKPKSSDNVNPFVKIVPDEGMPSRGNPFIKGNLYIIFRVKFPGDGQLSPEVCSILRTALPNDGNEESEVVQSMLRNNKAKDDDDHEYGPEVVHLNHANMKEYGHGGATHHDSTYDSDSDDGGKPVSCQQS